MLRGASPRASLPSGVSIMEEMVNAEGCVKFLSFTADIVATGTRGVIKELVKRKLVDIVITTCGTLDHDVARCWKDYYKGSFIMNDSKLHQEGVNRLGNVLVPNDSYGIVIEKKIIGLLEELYKEGKKELSTKELCREIGLRCCDETSILYWAAKNNIPVFVPGITDGCSRLPTMVLQPRPQRLPHQPAKRRRRPKQHSF